MAAQGAMYCGGLPSPWGWEQMGTTAWRGGALSTQDHSLLMALLRVRAHPPGYVPELSPDKLVSQMEPPVPRCVGGGPTPPCASVYLCHGPGRRTPWGILHPHRSIAWGNSSRVAGAGVRVQPQSPTPRAEQFPRKIPSSRAQGQVCGCRPRWVSVFQLLGRACVRTGSFPRLPGRPLPG